MVAAAAGAGALKLLVTFVHFLLSFVAETFNTLASVEGGSNLFISFNKAL